MDNKDIKRCSTLLIFTGMQSTYPKTTNLAPWCLSVKHEYIFANGNFKNICRNFINNDQNWKTIQMVINKRMDE